MLTIVRGFVNAKYTARTLIAAMYVDSATIQNRKCRKEVYVRCPYAICQVIAYLEKIDATHETHVPQPRAVMICSTFNTPHIQCSIRDTYPSSVYTGHMRNSCIYEVRILYGREGW